MSDESGLPVTGQAPRRRRVATWFAAGLAAVLVGFVFVLARSEPATTRAADSPLLGQPAPYIEATTIDGDRFALTDQLGKWVLVNFFATWCVPCREEHPSLIAFSQRHAQSGDAAVFGVVYADDTGAVRDFRDAEGGDWPMLVDSDGRIALEFGVSGVPESFLIDPDGVVVHKIVGGVDLDPLEALLAGAISNLPR